MQHATLDLGTQTELAMRVAYDPRADGKRRMILLGERYVTIKRRLRGMKMHLSVPVESYTGVVMTREDRPEGAFFRVSLAHRDPDLCVALKVSRDQGAMSDAWRHWAAFFAVPALVECITGQWESVDPIGAWTIGQAKASTRSDTPRQEQSAAIRSTLITTSRRGTVAHVQSFSRDASATTGHGSSARHRRGRGEVARPPKIFRGEREIISYE